MVAVLQQASHRLEVLDVPKSFYGIPFTLAGHLAFAVATTAYVLKAIRWEEKDLVDYHGATYRDYQQATPKLIPKLELPAGRNDVATAANWAEAQG